MQFIKWICRIPWTFSSSCYGTIHRVFWPHRQKTWASSEKRNWKEMTEREECMWAEANGKRFEYVLSTARTKFLWCSALQANRTEGLRTVRSPSLTKHSLTTASAGLRSFPSSWDDCAMLLIAHSTYRLAVLCALRSETKSSAC
jgi:hypothetical protein